MFQPVCLCLTLALVLAALPFTKILSKVRIRKWNYTPAADLIEPPSGAELPPGAVGKSVSGQGCKMQAGPSQCLAESVNGSELILEFCKKMRDLECECINRNPF